MDGFSQRELHCSVRVVHWLMSIFAWPESSFLAYPGLSSWDVMIAPAGLVLGGAVLFVYPVCSIDWSLRVERLEMMVHDLLLRTCTSNCFGLALLGARTRRPGLHVLRAVPAELRSA
jgi:hypothetical protein